MATRENVSIVLSALKTCKTDKKTAETLVKMTSQDFDNFLLQYNEIEKKYFKMLRRREQVRINVEKFRARQKEEENQLKEEKTKLLEEKETLEVEIIKLEKLLMID